MWRRRLQPEARGGVMVDEIQTCVSPNRMTGLSYWWPVRLIRNGLRLNRYFARSSTETSWMTLSGTTSMQHERFLLGQEYNAHRSRDIGIYVLHVFTCCACSCATV